MLNDDVLVLESELEVEDDADWDVVVVSDEVVVT